MQSPPAEPFSHQGGDSIDPCLKCVWSLSGVVPFASSLLLSSCQHPLLFLLLSFCSVLVGKLSQFGSLSLQGLGELPCRRLFSCLWSSCSQMKWGYLTVWVRSLWGWMSCPLLKFLGLFWNKEVITFLASCFLRTVGPRAAFIPFLCLGLLEEREKGEGIVGLSCFVSFLYFVCGMD